MKSSNLNEKSGSLWFFLLYIKMNETAYCQRNREKILSRAKDYYQNNKKVLRDKARNNYGEFIWRR